MVLLITQKHQKGQELQNFDYVDHFSEWHAYYSPSATLVHGFFRCSLPVETVDVKVKITSM